MGRRKRAGSRDDRLEFLSPEQFHERNGGEPVRAEWRVPGTAWTGQALRLSWDAEVDAGYLPLSDTAPADVEHQELIQNPVDGMGHLLLDFDVDGRLIGIEFFDKRALPPGLSPS